MLRVALIYARINNKTVPPMGLLSIAGFLSEKRVQVRIWDPLLSNDTFIDEVERFKPDIIGISFLTAQYNRAREISSLLRERIPLALYVCGGPHASALPEESLLGLSCDIAVVGEGELTMHEICKCLADSRTYHRVDGISYLSNGRVYHNPRRQLIGDLDIVPFTGRELLSTSFDWYLVPPGVIRGIFYANTATMITSRGCPYSCIFCASKAVSGNQFRRRSVRNVINEIQYLQQRYGVTKIWFLDDIFTFDPSWVKEFCRVLISEGLELIWSCQTRADALDDDLLRQMKASGCIQVELGIESGSDRMLKAISKGMCVQELRDKFVQIKRIGLRTMANFIVGIPGEDIRDIMLTYKLAKQLKPDFVEFNLCIPYPGSQLYHVAQQAGWLTKDGSNFTADWDEHTGMPVMRTNIQPRHLLKLRTKFQNRFFWTNYMSIILSFLRSPKHLLILIRSIQLYSLKNARGVCVNLLKKKFDTLAWDIYAHYSQAARKLVSY